MRIIDIIFIIWKYLGQFWVTHVNLKQHQPYVIKNLQYLNA